MNGGVFSEHAPESADLHLATAGGPQTRVWGINLAWEPCIGAWNCSSPGVASGIAFAEPEPAEGVKENRYYDPGIGRYLEPEPMEAKGPGLAVAGANSGAATSSYSYAYSNPVSKSDSDGEFGGLACLAFAAWSIKGDEASRPPMGDSCSDKYDHCLFACELSRWCGTGTGSFLGAAKEICDKYQLNDTWCHDADWYDQYADEIGEYCALPESEICPLPLTNRCSSCCATNYQKACNPT